MPDEPLLPEHWEEVRRSLRSLYLATLWAFVSCGVISIFYWVGGLRRLWRAGPTAAVRSIAGLRLAVTAIDVLAGVLAVVTRRTTDDAATRLAATVPAILAHLVDLVLWLLLGRALAAWAASGTLEREWARTARWVMSSIVVTGALGALAVVDAIRGGALAMLLLVCFVAWIRLLFTSWRTYRLFSTPLIAAGSIPPPPPGPGDRVA